MLEFLNQLTVFFYELIEANKRLLAALNDYQQLLVTGKTDAIEKATPQLEQITHEIRRLDEKRKEFVDEFFQQKGWEGPKNFSSIVELVKAEGVNDEEALAFEKARNARGELIEVLARVDAQNSLNITLIGQSMSFAEISLKAILGFNDKPSTYGPSDDSDKGPSLLDAQA